MRSKERLAAFDEELKVAREKRQRASCLFAAKKELGKKYGKSIPKDLLADWAEQLYQFLQIPFTVRPRQFVYAGK
jgi:hypothetical protein